MARRIHVSAHVSELEMHVVRQNAAVDRDSNAEQERILEEWARRVFETYLATLR